MALITTAAKYIAADKTQQKRITNQSGGTIYYSTTSDTNAEDTSVAVGASATITAGQFFISASTSKVRIEDVASPKAEGVEPISSLPGVWAGAYVPASKSTGTDVAFAEKKLFVSSVYLPVNKTITGVGFLLGSEGGTTKLVAGLFDSAGNLLAKSTETSEGTTAGTKETVQELAFSSAYKAPGPGLYFVGVTGNGTTAKFRAIPISGKTVFTTEASLTTKNTLASISAPSTFTADKGPVAFVY